jgi:SAM-dependent methyltransferase
MIISEGFSLDQLARLAQEAKTEFLAAHGDEVEAWHKEISRAVQESNERLRWEVREIAGGTKVCDELVAQATEYVDWLQWSFWDLAYFAVAIRPDPADFRHGISTCGLVYLAIRIFDDVIDRHFWYKARRPTLLSVVAEQHPNSQGIEGLTLLAGLLLFGDAVMRMAGDGAAVRTVLGSFRRAVLGAILEHAPREDWTPAYYQRLVQLKNVDFWRCLYAAVDPAAASPLHPFLERYYALAQKLNDVQDFAEDQQRGQPNLLSLYLPRHGGPAAAAAPAEVEAEIAGDFLALGLQTESLPPLERSVARLKLGESLREAFHLGLFPQPAPAVEPVSADEGAEAPLGLQWYSTLADVVERAGVGAILAVDCPVCGAGERRRLCEKQGFELHRCADCAHVYISPRIQLDLQLRMAAELEEHDIDNAFLEVQRIYAEPICHLLHLRAPGPRLLDLGFGRGYILRLARAYGFEAYGVDSSRFLVDQLRPEFGDRLHFAAAGAEPIPWDSFDVIVMSHVAEHLADPVSVLRDIRARLNPGGILYVAVPDLGALQFRLFGKHWEVVNPLVHFQYFNEASLSRLLTDCGFETLERVQYPPLPKAITPRWMRLMRKLGGNESGELAFLARRPGGDEPSLLTASFLESSR